MEEIKPLLIERLKSKGMDPSLISAFLKALTSLISSEAGIEPAAANQKMQSLGWNEGAVDYHSLQIAIACLGADTKKTRRPAAYPAVDLPITHQVNDWEIPESDLPVFEDCLYPRGGIHHGPDIPGIPGLDHFL